MRLPTKTMTAGLSLHLLHKTAALSPLRPIKSLRSAYADVRERDRRLGRHRRLANLQGEFVVARDHLPYQLLPKLRLNRRLAPNPINSVLSQQNRPLQLLAQLQYLHVLYQSDHTHPRLRPIRHHGQLQYLHCTMYAMRIPRHSRGGRNVSNNQKSQLYHAMGLLMDTLAMLSVWLGVQCSTRLMNCCGWPQSQMPESAASPNHAFITLDVCFFPIVG